MRFYEISEAWHGSPRSFRKFVAAKIGTGQGDAKHGWGMYLTTSQDRARFYADLSKPTQGFVYEVELPTGYYLDWDAPITQQADKIMEVLRVIMPFDNSKTFDALMAAGWKGLDAYKHLYKTLGSKRAASRELLAHGIVGINYLGRDEYDGEGVGSHVIFDPSQLVIKSKIIPP
jgi:hypothetical protein